jgi:transcriptional regulator GlxA family with amidase domain
MSERTRCFGFLMYPKYEELDLIGPWEMATMWRDYASGPACITVSEKGGRVDCAKGLKSIADHSFADCPPLDYLLIPGGFAAFDEMKNPALVAWARAAAHSAQHVLSVCTGSFILHAAGILAGRRATTHWKALNMMRELPGVTVVEQRWVRDGNVWTSAGVSAGMDLLLGFVEAVDGAEAAGAVQKNAEYYPDSRIYGSVAPPASARG